MTAEANYSNGAQLLQQLETNPKSGEAYDALGVFALENDSPSEAVELFGKAIQLSGPEPRYCAHLGEAFAHLGDYARAAACVGQALVGAPSNVDLRLAYANLLHIQGNHDQAGRNYELLLAQVPNHAESWFNLGVTRTIQQNPDQARRAYKSALSVKPGYPEAWNNLALLERSDGNLLAAETAYRRALLIQPDYADALYNFAILLQEQERLQEAIMIYERLLTVDPNFAEAHNNLGNCYLKSNRIAQAQNHFLETLAINASHKEAPWNLGFASLLMGDYARGWSGYEHRLSQHEIASKNWSLPRWSGIPKPGARILVHSEQGLGDTIQFARYLHLLRDCGMKVDVFCQPPLTSLLASIHGLASCTSNWAELTSNYTESQPGDCEVPFPSLSYHFKTRLENIPNQVPYLFVDPVKRENWRQLFAAKATTSKRIGIVWQGNPKHRNDHNRSIPVGALGDLLETPGFQFVGLQKDVAHIRVPDHIFDISALLSDFSETAAAIEQLDLVITVDTAVAHLAGAIGRPVWTLLPYAPDWRWLLHREDSPWYPSMRLFRQPITGDWSSVVQAVRRSLLELG
jgi:tetratricopeptide (TPR) repeat protein